MKNFIPVMRAKRLIEMKEYTDKEYSIQDRKHYMMLEKISVPYGEQTYEYGIQVTQDEIYFFITRSKANIYMSIVEIYDAIRGMKSKNRLYFKECLKKQLKQKENGDFYNQGLSYKMKKPVYIEDLLEIAVPQTGFSITNRELLILIVLIQEKSNALFRRSTAQKRVYVNGIIRLLIILLEEKDSLLLQQLGWNWDNRTQRFIYHAKELRKGRETYKYYLTQKEYDANMNIKKS